MVYITGLRIKVKDGSAHTRPVVATVIAVALAVTQPVPRRRKTRNSHLLHHRHLPIAIRLPTMIIIQKSEDSI